MSVLDHITSELQQARQVLDGFLAENENLRSIEKASQMILTAIQSGGKIFTCGNGGSHCDAMHFAEELTGRFRHDRRPLPALSISDPSHISCVANDFGFEHVFSRYISALGSSNDVLVAISTSGNSKNVLRAVEVARDLDMKTLALTGNDGGALGKQADLEVRVSHHGYADRIQEMHIKIIHILIDLVEQGLSE